MSYRDEWPYVQTVDAATEYIKKDSKEFPFKYGLKPGQSLIDQDREQIVNWIEANHPNYTKSHLPNPPPEYGTPDAQGRRKRDRQHDPNVPVGESIPNNTWMRDYAEFKESLEPEHLRYLGHKSEKMAYDFASGMVGAPGYVIDPDGLARTMAAAKDGLTKKWGPDPPGREVVGKALWRTAFPHQQMAEDLIGWISGKKNYKELLGGDDSDTFKKLKSGAKSWYQMSDVVRRAGEMRAAHRLSEDVKLRGYMRWMRDEPMSFSKGTFMNPEMWQRAMAEMAPSVATMVAATAVTGGGFAPAMFAMMGLEGSGQWSEGMRLLTEEGVIRRDERGNPLIQRDERGEPLRDERGDPIYVRDKLSLEEAAPIAGQTALIYSAIAAPMEAVQIGRATRLLKILPEAKKSFTGIMLKRAMRKFTPNIASKMDNLNTTTGFGQIVPKLLNPTVDFGAAMIEGGAIEWAQTVTQIAANKAISEGYGNTPEDALDEFGRTMFSPNFWLSEEGGMSQEASEAFIVGAMGEVGMRGAFKGYRKMRGEPLFSWNMPGDQRIGFKKALGEEAGQEPFDGVIYAEGEGPTVPDVSPGVELTTALITAPSRESAVRTYAHMLSEQAGGVLEGDPINALVIGDLPPEHPLKSLIVAGSGKEVDPHPEAKMVALIESLEDRPQERAEVFKIIEGNEVLKFGVNKIQRNILKKKLGPGNTEIEKAIDQIDADALINAYQAGQLENMNVKALQTLKEDGFETALEVAQEQALVKKKVTKDTKKVPTKKIPSKKVPSKEPDVDAAMEAKIDQQVADQLGIPLAEYQAQKAKLAGQPTTQVKTKVVPKKKIAPVLDINKEKLPISHLQEVQQQSGDLGVKKILLGQQKVGKKKGKPANLTTLNKLQKELLPEAEQEKVTSQNREVIVDKIAAKIFEMSPAPAPVVTKKPLKTTGKKKVVKATVKQPEITVEEGPLTETPKKITKLAPEQVFVFGSNEAGRHGKGAALTAKKKFGAVQGEGQGLQGQSYALPTKDKNMNSLTLEQIETNVDTFIADAQENPDKEFVVTKVGAGLAGYSPKEIGDIFRKKNVPDNVVLPKEYQSKEVAPVELTIEDENMSIYLKAKDNKKPTGSMDFMVAQAKLAGDLKELKDVAPWAKDLGIVDIKTAEYSFEASPELKELESLRNKEILEKMAPERDVSLEDIAKVMALNKAQVAELTAEQKLAKYLGEDKDVQFHGAIGSSDVYATIDGKKVELTDTQKEKLRKIGLALDTGGDKAIIAQGGLGEFKAELIAQQGAPAEEAGEAPPPPPAKIPKGLSKAQKASYLQSVEKAAKPSAASDLDSDTSSISDNLKDKLCK